MFRTITCFVIFICLNLASSTDLFAAKPSIKANNDWSGWRGPNRDGISPDKGLNNDWTSKKPKLLWTAKKLGLGFSSISIVGDTIFTMGAADGKQQIIALNKKDGSKIWTKPIGDDRQRGFKGPRCTPIYDEGLVYGLTKGGDLACLKAEDGSLVWTKNMKKDFRGKMMSGWGYSESPLIDGDHLICTPGGPNNGMVALDKKTGKKIWSARIPKIGSKGRDGAGYSSIVISNACGVRQYVQLMGRGVVSVRAKDGKFLWGYNKVANGTANIPTPIVSGNYVFCSTGYGAGSALVEVKKSDTEGLIAEEVYFLGSSKMQVHHGGMILLDGYIYAGHGHNQGYPICLEMKTGKIKWSKGRGPGKKSAAITYADGNLYFRYQNGTMALIAASPKGYKEKGTFDIPEVHNPSWPHPVVFGGKLYLREQNNLYCYDLSK